MRYISNFELYLWCLACCFVISLISQLIWVFQHKSQEKPDIIRLVTGMGITSGGSSIVLFFLMLYFIPSVHVVEYTDYHTMRFISSNWPAQLTKDYIDNKSGVDLSFTAVGYGTSKYVTGEVLIPKDSLVECEHNISGYNTTPPSSIRSKSSGAVRWYLYHN